MSYSAKISSKNPMAIVIMIDQSGSMSEHITWNGTQMTKATAVSEVINNLLAELISRSRSENSYRHYYDIMVIGYSGSGIKSLIASEDSYFMTPAQLAGSVRETRLVQRQRRLPDGRIIITNTKQHVWVEITADGRTPMRAAFTLVYKQLKQWQTKHSESFPPIVINISDGEATDGTPGQIKEITDNIKSLSSSDGAPLIMNIHLSRSSEKSVIFPSTKDELPRDRYAEFIFDISSPMPLPFRREISYQHYHDNEKEYIGMAYNASIADLVKLLNIGSTSINNIITL